VRGSIAGGVLVAAIAVAAFVAVGSAGAQSDPTSIVELVDSVRDQLGRLEAVQFANGQINMVRAVGGLAGIGVGVAVGSVVSYIGWRR
jgi:hypothetical protein